MEDTMANKQTFTPEEWTKIMESVALSGMAVTAADPSGLIGLLRRLLQFPAVIGGVVPVVNIPGLRQVS